MSLGGASVADLPAPAEIDSLTAPQVRQLLKTLSRHIDMLDSAYFDAQRLELLGHRPAYVVDFQLLFRFMLEADLRPDWEQELAYLFSHTATTFVIGPGTHVELTRFLLRRGLNLEPDGALYRRQGFLDAAASSLRGRDQAALLRLSNLLNLPNVKSYADLVTDVAVDEDAFEVAQTVLARRRTSASPEANEADALNWSAVAQLRRTASREGFQFYPYLLTATEPLLDGQMWTDELGGPLSRSPAEAIYTEVLLDKYEARASAAMDHTVEMSFQASRLATSLKKSPAQRRPEAYLVEPAWEHVIARGLVGAGLAEQLEGLADFVSDPVIRETQRIYDNAHLAATSFIQQQTEVIDQFEAAPTKLFDLILGIHDALDKKKAGSSGIRGLWKTVLAIDASDEGGFITKRLRDTRGAYEYMAVERHESTDGGPPLFIMRWPSALDAARVLSVFSAAYARHEVVEAELCVGTPGHVHMFDVDLPCELPQLLDAVREAEPRVSEHADDATVRHAPEPTEEVVRIVRDSGSYMRRVNWVRMNAREFDLYADTYTSESRGPMIGLFVQEPTLEHIATLYSETAGRYIFQSWLMEALHVLVA